MGDHVQLLLDVVVPPERERVEFLAELVDGLNAELHRMGYPESAWVVPFGERAALPSEDGLRGE